MIHLPTLLLAAAAAAVSALPTAPLTPRSAVFENSIITNPSALAWYDASQGSGAGGSSSSNSAVTAITSDTTTSGNTGTTSTYTCFTTATFPPLTSWASFATLWTAAAPGIAAANANAAALAGSSSSSSGTTASTLTQTLHAKITAISALTSLDPRLVLATVLQESNGRLDVPCTGTSNCGIMQAAPGSASFDAARPAASIEQMLRDGVQGVAGSWPDGGPGLAYWMGVYGDPWRALRAYNTGSVPDAGDLSATGGWGTASYVVDVANRLVGWDGVTRGSC
ncbi:exo-beta-protein [Diplodia corticola]|uniref:Exo-beta-protein n=1 Tax=Diplodia corticola TaxID=236234 RepID=A0A1J9RW00_9PEZI|nr:exo-beta-protein [Diplodia corticola]OJD36795.1 exo-beta-protein [Diplodia corticola]